MMDEIKQFLTLESYEIRQDDGDTFIVAGEDDVEKICCLKDSVFFGSVPCVLLEDIDPAKHGEVKDLLLDSGNGISTSFFTLVPESGGKKMITLNSLCTLQDLGSEDQDDIRSVLQYLSDDVKAAHTMLSPYLAKAAVKS
ncbi:MAG: hypothetical protein RL885_33090 [Planctomycetota bacterium]